MNGGMIKPPIPHRQSQLVLHQNQHGYAVIKSNSHSHGVDLIKIRKQIGKPAHHVMVAGKSNMSNHALDEITPF